MSTHQARVDAGVPTGGQYTTTHRAEADISLEDLADSLLESFSDQTDDSVIDREAAQRAIAQAYDSARHWESRKGVRERSRGYLDTDDLAQEALLSVLERQANGYVVEDPKAYMHTSAWGVAQQAGNTAVRQENRKALRLFNEACESRAAALGRRLTRDEEDQIATAIRDNWHDPRRKPSADFRRYAGQMEISMDGFESPDASGYLLPNSTMGQPGVENPHEVAPGSYTDRALSAIEGHEGDLRDARRMLWNALAETGGTAPMVEAGTMSQRRVTSARALINNHPGGVLGAVNDWEQGNDGAATEALFAPWGECDDHTRQRVTDQMRRFPDRAEDLWASALQLANTRNAARA